MLVVAVLSYLDLFIDSFFVCSCRLIVRLRAQVWHYHLGLPIVIVSISPEDGVLTQTTLSHRLDLGHKLQHVVPPGHWFGAYVDDDHSHRGESGGAAEYDFALVGCTVSRERRLMYIHTYVHE